MKYLTILYHSGNPTAKINYFTQILSSEVFDIHVLKTGEHYLKQIMKYIKKHHTGGHVIVINIDKHVITHSDINDALLTMIEMNWNMGLLASYLNDCPESFDHYRNLTYYRTFYSKGYESFIISSDLIDSFHTESELISKIINGDVVCHTTTPSILSVDLRSIEHTSQLEQYQHCVSDDHKVITNDHGWGKALIYTILFVIIAFIVLQYWK